MSDDDSGSISFATTSGYPNGLSGLLVAPATPPKWNSARTALRAGVAGGVLSTIAVATAAPGGGGADWPEVPTAVIVAALAAFAGATAVGIPFLIHKSRQIKNENAHFAESMEYRKRLERETLEKLKRSTELATLMDLNQGQIKDYHLIVTQQADKSFKSSQTAMWVGILMLVGCLFAGFYFNVTEIRWFVAGVAAISSTMAGYLTRTYLFMYKESIAQLNRYFDQPVLNSYYLTAERLSHGLEDGPRHEMRRQIIHEVLKTSAAMSSKRYEPEPEAADEPKIPRQKKKKQKAKP
ncbi:hypothetical protein ACFYSJ_05340 [Streptomyces sp. NPDC005248]|uniref:hypothetical protein n=1 Tax=Streptomyces sp. NPDC005248 TaxID=3364709 RepID=UPI00369E3708